MIQGKRNSAEMAVLNFKALLFMATAFILIAGCAI